MGFLVGLARNARLVDRIHIDLAWAEDATERPGRPAASPDLRGRRPDSWSRKRRVVVTARTATGIGARALSERLDRARGDMETRIETRIQECQLDLFADRTGAATLRGNQLRLWFASMAQLPVGALRRRALAHTRPCR